MRKRIGIERGATQQLNEDWNGAGGGGGETEVSNNFLVLTLYFFRLILLTDKESRPWANNVGETKRR